VVLQVADDDDLPSLAFDLNASHGRPLSLGDRRAFAFYLLEGKGLAVTARSIGVSPERLRHHVSSKNLAEKQKGRWVTRQGLPRRMLIYSRGLAQVSP
jgi:hypothetical protein